MSHHSQDIPEQQVGRKTPMHSERLASNLTVLLNLSGCSSVAVSDPLLPMWMSLILFSSCWFSVMSPPDASACRTAIRSSSCFSRVPQAHPLAQLELFSLFHSLCLRDSVFVCIHPCVSRQGSLNNRSGSFLAFVMMWFCRSSMRCKRSTTRTTSSVTKSFDVSRRNTESSRLNPRSSFHDNPWKWEVPLLLCQLCPSYVNFNSGATIRHGVPQAVPVRRVPSITQYLSCPTFASVLGNAQICSCSILMTDKDSLSHALVFPSLPILILRKTCAA